MTKNIQMNSNYYQLLSEKYEQQLSNKYIIYTKIETVSVVFFKDKESMKTEEKVK